MVYGNQTLFQNWCKLFILLILITSFDAYSNISWSGNIYKVINEYKKQHSHFSKTVCSDGADRRYYELLKEYRGQGNYMPEINGELDRNAIKYSLHHFQKKYDYIAVELKKLKAQKQLPDYKKIIDEINVLVSDLLKLKKTYHTEVFGERRNEIIKNSNTKILELRELFTNLLNIVPFLKSYNFPNDHLNNRNLYDRYKSKVDEDLRSKKLANRTFFYRKIIEDGSYDPDHTRPDIFLRSTLDTIYLNLQKEKDFISENIRFDLRWTLRNLEALLNRGHEIHIARLEEWLVRTEETGKFYKEIIKLKNKSKSQELIRMKNISSIKMKDYVYSKQSQVYKYWMNQPKLMKALFVLETILFNEVGSVDGPFGLERKDVTQVVLNRLKDTFYRTLDEKQLLVEHLNLDSDVYQKEHWLNVLFRVGEFSFTYHYIGSVVKIFCPDMSLRGKALRASNLKIILKTLNEEDSKFTGMRYFSRVSMLGKIDMSSVWHDYKKIPERPGLLATKQNILERHYLSNSYQYLYSFKDPDSVNYQVIEINDDIYAMTWIRGRPRFFYYRNPHLFTYFSKE